MNKSTSENELKKLSNTLPDEMFLNSIELENLPNKQLMNYLDLVSFCFLLSGVKDSSIRKYINNSRTTERFWEQFRKLPDFGKTFEYFSNRDLANTFKYVYYIPVMSKYPLPYIIKAIFSLKAKELIDSNSSMAEISKTLSFILKKNTSSINAVLKNKKPRSLNTEISMCLSEIKIEDFYRITRIDSNEKENLNSNNNNINEISNCNSNINEVIYSSTNNTSFNNNNEIKLEEYVNDNNNNSCGCYSNSINITGKSSQDSNLNLIKSKNNNIDCNDVINKTVKRIINKNSHIKKDSTGTTKMRNNNIINYHLNNEEKQAEFNVNINTSYNLIDKRMSYNENDLT